MTAGQYLLYSAVNFLILAAALVLIGRKLVGKMFRSHCDEIDRSLEQAEAGQAAAEAIRGDLAALQAQAEAERAEITAGAEHSRSAYLQQLQEETHLYARRADRCAQLDDQRRDMRCAVRDAALKRTAADAAGLLRQEPYLSLSREKESAIADRILELVQLTPGDRVYIMQHKMLFVTLMAAYPPSAEVAQRICAGLEETARIEGGKISFRIQTDPDLIGGLSLRVGDTIYDGTISNVLYTLIPRMKLPEAAPDADAAALQQELLDGIANLTTDVRVYQIGHVLSISDGICWCDGMSDVMYGELVEFSTGALGMVLDVEPDRVGCVIFGEYEHIEEHSLVRRSGQTASVPVGDGLIGRVVNANGEPVDGQGRLRTDETRPIECAAPAILDRRSVSVPLQTGIKAIDALTPIGRGQRELIIGDRQTGKTALAVDAILNQKGKDCICIYVAIGQKETTVAGVVNTLREHGAMEYSFVVTADADDSAPMQYIAPYAGTAMAEYFMYRGRDVLIVYDDLSKHAVAYRELSLLLHRPSGREAYPGDVFYLHSRLLERSARLAPEAGGGSITALPIVETQAGDISSYIPTNTISITDGQIFLETSLFNQGQRPAINAGLSVSRVGGSAQIGAMRQVAGQLRIELAEYRELESFSQFGADLDQSTKDTLAMGARMTAILCQKQNAPLPVENQVLIIFAVSQGFANDVAVADMSAFEAQLNAYFNANHPELLARIASGSKLDEETLAQLRAAIAGFKGSAE